jgi:hypothetical protein
MGAFIFAVEYSGDSSSVDPRNTVKLCEKKIQPSLVVSFASGLFYRCLVAFVIAFGV